MGEWLSDTPIFQATMTEAQKADAANFRKKVTMPATIPNLFTADQPTNNESNTTKKENTMTNKTATKKTAAKTTKKATAKKETKMNELKGQDYVRDLKAKYENAVKMAATLGLKPKGEGAPTNFVTGKNVNRDKAQNDSLLVVAAVEGYPTNEWATRNQIHANKGKVIPGSYGAKMFIPKGKDENGNPKFAYYDVFNMACIEWEDGKPETFTKPTTPSKSAFKPITLNLPGGGSMTVHNKAELNQYKKIVAMMS